MKKQPREGVRITHQFKGIGRMEYWLDSEATKLRLSVFPRENADDAGDWRVTARLRAEGTDAPAVTEWAATRVDALEEVGRTWSAQHLPTLDWGAVVRVLTAVRAL